MRHVLATGGTWKTMCPSNAPATATPKGPPMPDCEAEERNKRALYILENEWGCGRIDVGQLQRILRGETCDHD